MGTKDFDGRTHKRLLQKLPLKPNQCRRLLGLIATVSGGNVLEAQAAGDEGDVWTLSGQVAFAILLAPLTCMFWCALRRATLSNTTLQVRTVERGIQTEHNPFDSTAIPTSVYCYPDGECYHKSRKCEGAYSETDDEMENSMKDELERRESMAFGQYISLGRSECSSVCERAEQCCGCAGGRPHYLAREPWRDATRRSGRLSEPPSTCT